MYPEGATLRKIPRLDTLDTAALVAALDSPNGWQRDTAERLLVHEASKSVVKPLKKLMTNAKRPKVRLQALHTLNALGSLSPDIAVTGLKDSHPAIRENSIQLCEQFLRKSEEKEHARSTASAPAQLIEALLALADDPEPRVRQQLAFTLGEWDDLRAVQSLVKLANDSRLQTAVLSSAPRHVSPMLAAVFAGAHATTPNPGLIEQLIGLATALGNDEALAKTLTQISPPISALAICRYGRPVGCIGPSKAVFAKTPRFRKG